MKTNFEKLREDIGQECIDFGNFEGEQVIQLGKFMDLAEKGYVIIQWPESQQYMNEEWFYDEAVLDIDCKFGDSAYFIPIKRVM